MGELEMTPQVLADMVALIEEDGWGKDDAGASKSRY